MRGTWRTPSGRRSSTETFNAQPPTPNSQERWKLGVGNWELTDPQTLAVISGDTRCGIDWHDLARGVGGLRGFREEQRRRPSRGETTTAPKTVRLYVFDCGVINVNRGLHERYKVARRGWRDAFLGPLFSRRPSEGTLMWDLGILPDDTVEARARGEQGNPTATSARSRPCGRWREHELGYRPARIIAAFSARMDQRERQPVCRVNDGWAAGRTGVHVGGRKHARQPHLLRQDQGLHVDQSRQGRIRRLRRWQRVLKPRLAIRRHQVLVLNLARTGRIMIAGDLYHYPQERTLHRPPPDTEFHVQQSAASRVMIEEYLKRTKTEIWIEHDFVANEAEEIAGVLRVRVGGTLKTRRYT